MRPPIPVHAAALVLLSCACDPASSRTHDPTPPSAPSQDPPTTVADLETEAVTLAQECKLSDTKPIDRLLARAAARAVDAERAGRFDSTWNGLAHAVATCSPHGERILVSWLGGDVGLQSAASRGLAGLARRHGRLEAASIVALLERSRDPGASVWLALAELPTISASLANQIVAALGELAVTPERLDPSAVRVLAKVGPLAVKVLADIATGEQYALRVRRAAIGSLQGVGADGREVLNELLELPLGPGLLQSTIDALGATGGFDDSQRARLRQLSLTAVSTESEALARAEVGLRCAASAALAKTWNRAIAECDPLGSSAGQLAEATVLRRSTLGADARRRWRELLASDSPRLRQAALSRLLPFPDDAEFEIALVAALQDANPGTVAVGARILRDLARTSPPPGVSGALRDALTKRLIAPTQRDAIATTVALIEAGSALGLMSLKDPIAAHCRSPYGAVQRAAQDALRSFRSEQTCEPVTRNATRTSSAATPRELVVSFGDHAARLTLDPSLAPMAVARVLTLAEQGYYDGMEVFTTSEGALQFGDRDADGFANGEHEPLASELRAAPFGPLCVGLAQTGLDAGSSQLFITLDDRPDLDLAYPLLGHADPAWWSVEPGARIRNIRPPPP